MTIFDLGHTLSVDDQGQIWSWGRNNYGQLGHGHKNDNKELPQIIKYFAENEIKIVQIGCGFYHNVARDSDNKCYSWGANESYQCGDGTTSALIKPKLIEALKDLTIVDIKVGGYHNIAMTEEFSFYVWGANNKYGCMNGNNSNITVPTKFDPKSTPEIANEIVVAIWPGYHASRVIVSRNQN